MTTTRLKLKPKRDPSRGTRIVNLEQAVAQLWNQLTALQTRVGRLEVANSPEQAPAKKRGTLAALSTRRAMSAAEETIGAVRDEKVTTSDATPHGDGLHAARVPQRNQCPACGSFLTEPLHRSPDGHGEKYLKCTVCQHRWATRELE